MPPRRVVRPAVVLLPRRRRRRRRRSPRRRRTRSVPGHIPVYEIAGLCFEMHITDSLQCVMNAGPRLLAVRLMRHTPQLQLHVVTCYSCNRDQPKLYIKSMNIYIGSGNIALAVDRTVHHDTAKNVPREPSRLHDRPLNPHTLMIKPQTPVSSPAQHNRLLVSGCIKLNGQQACMSSPPHLLQREEHDYVPGS